MNRKLLVSVSALFAVFLLINACNKIDTTTLGGDLIPNIDNVNTFEKIFDVITDNKLFSDTTRMLYGEPHPLGIIENDIEFGKTTATLYSSFTPNAYRVYPFTVKRDSVTLDSVVLSLGCTAVFGDTNSIQQFEVKEISRFQDFDDSAYFLNSPDFLTEGSVLGTATVDFKTLNDSVFYRNAKDTIRSNNELRILLDTAWARQFVNYDTTAGSPYNNDSTFKRSFKGLEVKVNEASPNKSALAYINLGDNARTRITFYYRVVNNGKTDTSVAIFGYTNDPHASLVRRTPMNNYLANVNNTEENDARLFIQASPGSYATVKIPALDTFSNHIIHRAELICEKAPSDQDFYAAPKIMFIDAPNAAGDSVFAIRNDFAGAQGSPGYDLTALGGTYSKNKYVFNLSRYVQSIVARDFTNPTLRIYAPYSTYVYPLFPNTNTPISVNRAFLVINEPISFGRIVLYGGGEQAEPARRMRLRIIYSKI